jgi:hypothetical protein
MLYLLEFENRIARRVEAVCQIDDTQHGHM